MIGYCISCNELFYFENKIGNIPKCPFCNCGVLNGS